MAPADLALAPVTWPTFAFVITRATGLMLTAPLWSMSGVPRIHRAAVVLILAAALLPAAPRSDVPTSLGLLPVGMILELIVGAAIGLTASVFVQGVALAGDVLALQMGLSLGPAASPLIDVAVPGVGQLKTMLALVVYVTLNGHLMLVEGLARSLQAIPPGLHAVLDAGPDLVATLLGAVFDAAVRTAAPALVALLLVNLAVAVTSRAVPQIQAILVLFPVTIGVGLLMVGLSLTVIASVFGDWVHGLPERVALVVQAFTPGGR